MSETEEQNINDMSYQRELEVDMYGEDVVLLLKVNTEVIVLDEKTWLHFELSNPSDLTFLLFSSIDETAFQQIMSSQNVSIPFNEFPTHFFSILDKIHSVKGSSSSMLADLFSFSICLEKENEENNESYRLRIIQKSSFLTIPLLSLPFSTCSDEDMIRYLRSIILSYQNGTIQESNSCKLLQSKHNEEISRLEQEHNQALLNVQSTYESQIQSLRDQLATLENEKAQTIKDQNSQWEQQYYSLQMTVDTLSQQLIGITSERDELSSSVITLQEELLELRKNQEENKNKEDLLQKKEENEKSLIQEIEASKKQIEELKVENEKMKELEEEVSQLENSVNVYEQQLEEYKNEVERQDAELQLQKQQLEEKENAIDSLTKQVESLTKQCVESANKIKEISHTSKMKDKAISCLNLEINKLKLGSSYSLNV